MILPSVHWISRRLMVQMKEQWISIITQYGQIMVFPLVVLHSSSLWERLLKQIHLMRVPWYVQCYCLPLNALSSLSPIYIYICIYIYIYVYVYVYIYVCVYIYVYIYIYILSTIKRSLSPLYIYMYMYIYICIYIYVYIYIYIYIYVYSVSWLLAMYSFRFLIKI